jgi:AraC-like DNA-binding protein
MEPSLQKLVSRIRTVALLTQIHYLHSTKAVKPVILDERIRKMLVYIEQHLKDDITMDDLSGKFFITKNHLHSVFHKTVGTPVMKYITTKRLGLVRQEMLNGIKAGEAAYRAGFNDYTTFYRAYKSFYGSAPSKLLASDVNTSIS